MIETVLYIYTVLSHHHTDVTRWTQTWTCQACGHSTQRPMKYAKYGGPEEPLWKLALRSRCTKCGARGAAKITENRDGGGDHPGG